MAASVESALPKLGKYLLLERLGSGGMADVYLALQEGAGGFAKRVVIKRILRDHAADAAFVEMLLAEARLAANLSHQNVVQIFDAALEDGTYHVAMEYVAGPNLLQLANYAQQRHIDRRAPFVRLCCGVAEGLDHAQTALGPDGKPLEIVHRDLNPPNILVNLDGLPKICDFGIARRAREVTTGGLLKGKSTYMAPEQIRGDLLDGRADLFALGVVLFETTTGRRLFKRDTDLQVFHAVLHEPIPKPSLLESDYPPRLEELVMWCLERDRERRPANARALLQGLEEYLRGVDDPAAAPVGLRDWVRSAVPDEVQGAFARPPSRENPRVRPQSLASLVALTSTPVPLSPALRLPPSSVSISSPSLEPTPEPQPLPVVPKVLKITLPTRIAELPVPLRARGSEWFWRRAMIGVAAMLALACAWLLGRRTQAVAPAPAPGVAQVEPIAAAPAPAAPMPVAIAAPPPAPQVAPPPEPLAKPVERPRPAKVHKAAVAKAPEPPPAAPSPVVAPPKPAPVAVAPAAVAMAPLTPAPADFEPGVLFAPGMTRPERLTPEPPSLLAAAAREGAHGTVLARCDISRRGLVHHCEVVRAPSSLERPLIDALQAARMKPATLGGKPVALHGYTLTVALP